MIAFVLAIFQNKFTCTRDVTQALLELLSMIRKLQLRVSGSTTQVTKHVGMFTFFETCGVVL